MSTINTSNWKYFLCKEVFNFTSSKKTINANTVKIYDKKIEGSYSYVVRSEKNNGIKGYIIYDRAALNSGNTITFSCDTANAFYQPRPYFTGNRIKILTLKDRDLTEGIGLFMITVLNKAFSMFSWGQSFKLDVLLNVKIKLPVIPNNSPDYVYTPNDIDWDYMEKFIAKIEREQIAKIDAYFKVTGLNDYELTEEDKEILSLYEELTRNKSTTNEVNFQNRKLEFKKYILGDLFDYMNGDTDIQKNHINNKGHYVISSGQENCGVIGKSDVKAKIIPAKTITVDMFGYSQYRDFDYKLVTHARVFALIPKSFELNVQRGLYLVTVIRQITKAFSYDNMCSYNKIKNKTMLLPSYTDTNEIAWDYMEKFIKVTEKKVVANAVKYKDKMIAELDKIKENIK